MAAARPLLGKLPPGVYVDVWDAQGRPPANGQAVEFWVPPFPPLSDYVSAVGQLPGLRVIQTLTAGYDHVRPSVPPGVTLCNAGDVHNGPAAEWAVAALLAVARSLPTYVHAQAAGQSDRHESDSLIDKTILILGYGGIGKAVEQRLAGFEAEVIRVAGHSRPGVHGPEELDRLLPRTDIVIICVPLSSATTGLVDANFLSRLPDRAIVVNVARGPVVDQAALEAEVRAGRLRAALDVATPDPLPPGHSLRQCQSVLYTPHVAGATRLALPRVFGLVGDQIRRSVAGQPLLNVVA
jgi:phosphoglycerate dehydrogenase-like enzyme